MSWWNSDDDDLMKGKKKKQEIEEEDEEEEEQEDEDEDDDEENYTLRVSLTNGEVEHGYAKERDMKSDLDKIKNAMLTETPVEVQGDVYSGRHIVSISVEDHTEDY